MFDEFDSEYEVPIDLDQSDPISSLDTSAPEFLDDVPEAEPLDDISEDNPSDYAGELTNDLTLADQSDFNDIPEDSAFSSLVGPPDEIETLEPEKTDDIPEDCLPASAESISDTSLDTGRDITDDIEEDTSPSIPEIISDDVNAFSQDEIDNIPEDELSLTPEDISGKEETADPNDFDDFLEDFSINMPETPSDDTEGDDQGGLSDAPDTDSVESYTAIPNSELPILQEDGSIQSLADTQAALENDIANDQVASDIEPYTAITNPETPILQEDGSIQSLADTQAALENDINDTDTFADSDPQGEIAYATESGEVLTPQDILQAKIDDIASDDALSSEQKINALNAIRDELLDYDTGTSDDGAVSGSSGLRDLRPIDDVGDWLGDINPNFDAFDPESPYCNNCGSCAYAVFQRLEGNPDICASADNIGYNDQMEALTGMDLVSMGPDEIEQRLLEQGDGAHAIIGIDRAEGPGHWFNAACIDGKVVAIDGQSGEVFDWPPDYGDVVNWDMSISKEDKKWIHR